MYRIVLLLLLFRFSCSAAPPDITRRAVALQSILQQADDAYYNQNESLMGDEAYDALRAQYQRLIHEWPELATPEPVGASVDSANRVEHPVPVLSLEKVYSDNELNRFIQKTGTNLFYCVEPKLDGLTVVLHYRNGLLTQAATRGNGKTGKDVTAAVLASGAVPSALSNAPDRLDIRGEALLTRPAFDALNLRRAAENLEPLKNPRNAAAGTLMLTDYTEVARRHLSIQVFDLLSTDAMPASHADALDFLEQLGLPVVENLRVPAGQVVETVQQMNHRRSDFPFATDGIVIKVDDLAIAESLGATAHHPRSAIARKYHQTPVQTCLRSIEWTRGQTGKLTPVACFDPVEIDGAVVQRASLYNLDHLRAMDLKIGDRISVIRSGGSVPEIVGVLTDLRTGEEAEIPDPDR
jgi:DNA ligase (NAD+)